MNGNSFSLLLTQAHCKLHLHTLRNPLIVDVEEQDIPVEDVKALAPKPKRSALRSRFLLDLIKDLLGQQVGTADLDPSRKVVRFDYLAEVDALPGPGQLKLFSPLHPPVVFFCGCWVCWGVS